ncbi:phage baseplate assembly protein V [Chryseolinea soli]|uniref:Gp5/Type VI secretion system Vgr protein OB-fold domain-containing protein n=1 Tax=Chryseolinea soli TaxID=2321403 RepID=A0A385SQC3_9BACT|nr:phage baseplate assembly protein V [Chryseolinea soli]AYB33993.1 hypothetical protein D4L85_26950 [Chryseolinea soli]
MIIPGTAQEQNKKTDTVAVTVRIDGKDVTMDPGGLMAVSIGLEANKVPWARLIFADGSVEKQTFEKSDTDTFSPGKTVEILMGYGQDKDTIFKGVVTRHAVKIMPNAPFRLELECKDPVVKATVVKKSLYHYKQTDKAIIQDILGTYPDVKSGDMKEEGTQHDSLVQYNVSDWDFMVMRADANGMFLRAQGGSVDLLKPEIKGTADLQVQFGMSSSGLSLQEFESEIDVRNHYPSVKGHTWDASKQEVAEEKASKDGGGGGGGLGGVVGQVASVIGGGGAAKKDFPDVLYSDKNTVELYHGGDVDSKALTAWVDAKMKRGELSRIRGRVALNGAKILPGDTLEVNGVSSRFNGKHLVTGVLHQYARGHWKTDIQFGWMRDFVADEWTSSQPDASGLVPGIRGLHVGVVSKLEGDSRSGDFRIQVRLPFVAMNANGSQADGIWARLANVYAGDKRGFIFRPEIDDEVIVGFINNDPNDAVVLAAMNSEKNVGPSEIKASDKNEKKGFISKSGMQFLFDDDAQKITVSAGDSSAPHIELDGKGSKVTIACDSSNSIELSSSGVTVKGTRIDLN